MNWHTWELFLATMFVVSAIPGPNMMLVMSHGARHGMRRTTATMAGALLALVLMFFVSAAGLGVFLTAWPRMFDALRLIGAGYLIWLGIKAWRARVEDAANDPAAEAAPLTIGVAATPGALFRNGFLVSGSNPKALLFAVALTPQFIDPAAPKLPQFAVLVVTLAVCEVGWYVVYCAFGTRIGASLRSARVVRIFNRLTGGVFVGFGAAMALVRH
ncbi:LysE family translocator [Burkholderia sp. 22PA0106]|uniref:LysE family translocator n=1 Tax=Burkholderia sp. 22PA0106 TaxID=3237371 RepID=UPI0039C36E5B